MCNFCNFQGDYDDFPDGTICWLGITCCADCIDTEKAQMFREGLEVMRVAIKKVEILLREI
jgi:hypothetical protein